MNWKWMPWCFLISIIASQLCVASIIRQKRDDDAKCATIRATEHSTILGGECDNKLSGETCVFQCDDYYATDEKELTLTCTNGVWSGSGPVCKATCATIVATEHSTILGGECDNKLSGDTCVFQCENNYATYEVLTLTCADGSWSGTQPICRAKCDAIVATQHSTITSTGGECDNKLSGDTCVFQCDNYSTDEGLTLTCADGSWSGTPPVCKAKCATIEAREHSTLLGGTCYNKLSGETCVFKCDNNYTTDEGLTLTCSDGSWSGTPPVCRDSAANNVTPTIKAEEKQSIRTSRPASAQLSNISCHNCSINVVVNG